MTTILHVSDLHFGPPFVPSIGEAVLDAAAKLAPDVLVVTGDLTQRARREQFAEARAFLDAVPARNRLVIPGNHDVPLFRIGERLSGPLSLYREYIAHDTNPVLRLPDAAIVGLDSTAPYTAISNGRISPRQLDHAEEVFAEVDPGVARIVAAHHHFAPAPDYLHDWTVPKARRAMRRFVRLGVDLILGGHLHRAFIGNSRDFYPVPGCRRGVIIVQSGTTTSHRGRGRERETNSFNSVVVDERTITVTHYMFEEGDHAFAPASRHVFPRAFLDSVERAEVLSPEAAAPPPG